MAGKNENKTVTINLHSRSREQFEGIIRKTLEKIGNGSLTIFKQDGHIIQIDIKEMYLIE